jgi:TnpA family transposase
MPRRSFLTPAERASLLAFPVSDDELIRHYTFSEPDLSVIRQRRGNRNSLGFAVRIGLNKGEAKNAPARAVFLNRLGEIRDRSFENQRYRASGLNLVVAAIVLWNTIYPERAVQALRDSGRDIDENLLPHLAPLGWEHINLTGDYIWQQSKQVEQGRININE